MKCKIVIRRKGQDGNEIKEEVLLPVLSEGDVKMHLHINRERAEAQHGKSNIISVELIKE